LLTMCIWRCYFLAKGVYAQCFLDTYSFWNLGEKRGRRFVTSTITAAVSLIQSWWRAFCLQRPQQSGIVVTSVPVVAESLSRKSSAAYCIQTWWRKQSGRVCAEALRGLKLKIYSFKVPQRRCVCGHSITIRAKRRFLCCGNCYTSLSNLSSFWCRECDNGTCFDCGPDLACVCEAKPV